MAQTYRIYTTKSLYFEYGYSEVAKMKITISIPDKVFETCKEDEYFKMRVDFNASDNSIKSITIDDGYGFTKADFTMNEQSTESDKMSEARVK